MNPYSEKVKINIKQIFISVDNNNENLTEV